LTNKSISTVFSQTNYLKQ